ncbi:hypothetical protein [Dyadobacter aurulentus]|uniref:hypothetical protein n=1 Tax=Dyadobacter sp. UC 10 TaxID=2605428 RepID=UPI0011F15392|nr:hypothetical protein [Dyadobacter sp. UC 10]KAA0992508.1 hypothetical protein FXO21_21230 [Dyadobacter sp. UC 10]
MEIGTIKAVHIYMHNKLYVTAELELNVKGSNYSFGGESVFVSGKNGGESCDAPVLGRFLFRCMQICAVDSWDLLKSQKVMVEVSHGKAVAIANASGDKWFNPSSEFESLSAARESEIS